MQLKKRLIHAVARGLVMLGKHGRPEDAVRLGNALARRMKLDPKLNKAQLRANLRRFFPGRDEMWVENVARSIQANSLRARLLDKHFLPKLSTDALDYTVQMVNSEHPERARAAGRGAILVSMHYGRFWATPVWFSRHGYLASAFQSSGGRLPSSAETLSGGTLAANDPKAALRAVRSLKAGNVLFLLLDAGRIPNPATVEFLGQPTFVSPATVRLARAADAVIIPGLVPIDPSDPARVCSTFYATIDPREIPEDEPIEVTLRRILEPIEAQILADPSQWYGAINAHRRVDVEAALAAVEL